MSNGQLEFDFGQTPENSQAFFARKRSWSASKHRIMLRYIQSHCYSLGGDKSFQSNYINYVDGFAGEGRYDEGSGIEYFVTKSDFWKRYDIDLLDTDGSPLIALKCAKAFKEENRVSLRCFFAEEHKETNQKLRKNCQEIAADLDYKIYPPQSFDETFPQIMEDLGDYPSVFFLDSFGVKGLDFEKICLIGDYLSRYKGELFLLFHNTAVARHAGYLTQKSESDKMKKAADTYMQNLTAFLGPNSDKDWGPQWLALKDHPQQFERWALRYFVRRICHESRFKGVASFEIKERYNDPRPQYNIVVCSNHPRKAFGDFLNDFFADENEQLFYEEDKSKLNKNFLRKHWDRQVEDRKIRATPEIIEILREKNQQWMALRDVITEVILSLSSRDYDLGYLKRCEYRKIFIELFRQGIIQSDSLSRKGEPKLESNIKIV